MKIKVNSMKFMLVLCAFCAAAVPGAVRAQESDAAAVTATDAQAPLIQTISFNRDSSIRDALRFLAARYQRNIVPSPRVDGPLTVSSLRDVTFEEAMSAILGNGFVYEYSGNFINVYSAEEYKRMKEDPARLETKVFRLYYISAAEAMRLIAPVMSNAGVIQGSSPAERVVPTGESISAGSVGGDSMALNDILVIKDYPEKLAEIEIKLAELDQRPLQVLVEAAILSVKLNEDIRFGIDWNTLKGVAINTVGDVASVGGGAATSGFAPVASTGPLAEKLTIGVSMDNVAAIITALESVTDTTVLANPRILAINKQLGQVYIGRKIGYRDQTTTGTDGTTIAGAVSFLETGTKLAFRPYIGNDGYIRMDIQPKDSTGNLSVAGIPDETSTELATNIMLRDGETVVIGGLFRNVVTTSRSQVPLLGDLPILGGLFRGTRDSVERQEVVVMLTPHIIKSPSDMPADKAKEDVEFKLEGARQQMQWFGRAKLAEQHFANAIAAWRADDFDASLEEVQKALDVRPTYTEALRLRKTLLKIIEERDAAMLQEMLLQAEEEAA